MPGRGVEAVVFDYGGVLAEEGFSAGLKAIAVNSGIEPEGFFHNATEIIYDCGYVKGLATAKDFWSRIRKKYEVLGDDDTLTGEIHNRFVLRMGMMRLVRSLKKNGIRTAILSDQTDWLYKLDERDDFLKEFSPVLNSFRLGITKREPEIFEVVQEKLDLPADHILFVDDNSGHVERAGKKGLQVHLFRDEESFRKELSVRNLLQETEVP